MTTDVGSYVPDFLVVALGADYDMDCHAGPRRRRIRVLHAQRRRADARRSGCLRRRKGPHLRARAAVQVSAGAVRGGVPPARALRAAGHPRVGADSRSTFPMQRPVPVTGAVAQMFRDGLAERGIDASSPSRSSPRSIPPRTTALLASGERCRTTSSSPFPSTERPIHSRLPASRSNGWVPVDQTEPQDAVSRASTQSATSAPGLGRFRRRASSPRRPRRVVADDIAATISGAEPPPPYGGIGGLLCRVRRRARLQGRGQLSEWRGARGRARTGRRSRTRWAGQGSNLRPWD